MWGDVVVQKHFVDSEIDPNKQLKSGELALVLREEDFFMSDEQGLEVDTYATKTVNNFQSSYFFANQKDEINSFSF